MGPWDSITRFQAFRNQKAYTLNMRLHLISSTKQSLGAGKEVATVADGYTDLQMSKNW
jgi:hypothetical protein